MFAFIQDLCLFSLYTNICKSTVFSLGKGRQKNLLPNTFHSFEILWFKIHQTVKTLYQYYCSYCPKISSIFQFFFTEISEEFLDKGADIFPQHSTHRNLLPLRNMSMFAPSVSDCGLNDFFNLSRFSFTLSQPKASLETEF